MKALIVAAVLLVGVALAGPTWNQLKGYRFEDYCNDFRRSYPKNSEEFAHRKQVFEQNLATIQAHNADKSQSYKKGVNQFTDWTEDEFRSYNRYYKSEKPHGLAVETHKVDKNEKLPASVDWRLNNNPRVLTAIKNQGMCGNCWAHSSAESMESHFAIKTGQLPVLSTQQITSCCTYVDGCGGGSAEMGWAYVNTTSGLTTEWAYPFVDMFAASMSKSATAACYNYTKKFKNFGWFNELTEVGIEGMGQGTTNSAESAKSLLAKVGPLSIAVAALGWKDYESGIYTNGNNSTKNWGIDHAVQMVGYGSNSDGDYWIVRNSWGTLWGDKGFIYLSRPKTEPCNVWGSTCGTSGCLSQLDYPKVFQQKTKNF